ncbi:hypothetical protein RF55_8473 [Lasius niger]|uniref:Uncharacterized protein n=1 Tax=Lasius niger TaxID=67767 RepID=A0A0J7KMU6_LASNI|nr:hypothetical protein RF55_8473 [Lasius niger]
MEDFRNILEDSLDELLLSAVLAFEEEQVKEEDRESIKSHDEDDKEKIKQVEAEKGHKSSKSRKLKCKKNEDEEEKINKNKTIKI